MFMIKFNPSFGFLTKKFRNIFLTEGIKNDKICIEDIPKAMLLYPDEDKSSPIYFWQLYSILGDKPIYSLIKSFYTKVLNDEQKWFSEEFLDLGDLDYHVNGQVKFWIDIMGGGQQYVGGEKRVNNKHKLVKNIMTNEGAERWMMHMRNTINEQNIIDQINDKRIIVCIYDFLEFFINRYAIEFDFNLFSLIKDRIFITSKL